MNAACNLWSRKMVFNYISIKTSITLIKFYTTTRGRVIGPTFQFNVSEIKFGLVSFGEKPTTVVSISHNIIPTAGFPHVSEVVLTNTSEVLMTFRLRVPGEERSKQSDHSKKEFTIQPHSGTLPPSMQRSIKVLAHSLLVV